MSVARNPKNYSEELESILQLCRAPHMGTARLLQILDQDHTWAHFQGQKNSFNQEYKNTHAWRSYREGGAAFRLAVSNNRYVAIPSHLNNEMIVPAVMELIDDSTEAVVELGCGWGRHLFGLRNLVEHDFPALRYFGCELSDTGLEAGRSIAALELGRASVKFESFDYLAPSFEFLHGLQNVVFFTCHSVEQIKYIGEELFHAMAVAAPKVRVIHCEPVGWQLNDELVRKAETDNKIEMPATFAIRLGGEVDDSFSARMPVALGWNRNLVACLMSLQNQGAIKIEFIDPNCAGNDIYNPSTIIQWTKGP
ncbi:MAG: class I SAM-dependent methyltransferase [Rhodospirillaceae bacterium]|nr:MAG: class I SAM-dependent methyltransferase [Rhodospirillaceae bacterium]